jgi:ubiquinone/menaquinone biosynthesis C-methylase UbiE
MKYVWRRLVAFGFRLLYNELAWLYDPVSWLVSKGQWRRWGLALWPWLPASGRVLEIGPGPGHLLADLATAGYEATGLDLSAAMLRLARHRLRRRGLPARLCRGCAEALPFALGTFDAVLLTFPTALVYDPACLEESARVLRPGGRLLVVEMATLSGHSPLDAGLEWLYCATGQRGPTPDLPGLLRAASLDACREQVQVADTIVSLVLADKPQTPSSSSQPR